MSLFQTIHGHVVDPMNLDPGEIDVRDIARSLSQTVRFRGHTTAPYTVGQHSVHACDQLMYRGHGPEVCLQGLFHDSPEVWLCDLITPLKGEFYVRAMFSGEAFVYSAVRSVEDTILWRVAKAFGLPYPFHPDVDEVDKRLCRDESEALRPGLIQPQAEPLGVKIDPWPWETAEAVFLDRFRRLTEAMQAGNAKPEPPVLATAGAEQGGGA